MGTLKSQICVSLLIAAASISWTSSAFGDVKESWVTVFYQVAKKQTIRVKMISNGAKRILRAGQYLEAYLPRSLFPSNRPVTKEDVEKLSPYLAAHAFPAGFEAMPCGGKADVIHGIVRSAQRAVRRKEKPLPKNTVPATVDDGDDVAVAAADLLRMSGKTMLIEVLTEELGDDGIDDTSGMRSLPICNANPDNLETQNLSRLKNVSFATIAQSYSERSEVEKMIEWAQMHVAIRARRNPDNLRKPSGCCEAYVARALFYSGLTDHLVQVRNAKDVGCQLEKVGFVNLFDEKGSEGYRTPKSAPKGAILVYSGGASGHVEIKTAPEGHDGYISDFYSKKAPPGRKLIGIYVKN